MVEYILGIQVILQIKSDFLAVGNFFLLALTVFRSHFLSASSLVMIVFDSDIR